MPVYLRLPTFHSGYKSGEDFFKKYPVTIFQDIASYYYMQQQLEDSLVIRNVLQGQSAAYAMLVDKYQSFVFTMVMRYVNDRELAEELAQDVFVKAYRCLADFKGSSKFSTWLYTIAHTTCLSHLRKKKDPAILLDEEKMIAVAGNNIADDPFLQLEQKNQQILLANAIKHLADTDAQILALYYHGGQSVEEIGLVMALSASNIKVRLFRARQQLKWILEKKYSGELIGLKKNNA